MVKIIMTRRDYELITNTLAQAVNDCKYEATNGLMIAVDVFCDNLGADNPNFNALQLIDSIQIMNVNPRAIDGLQALHNKYLDMQPISKF